MGRRHARGHTNLQPPLSQLPSTNIDVGVYAFSNPMRTVHTYNTLQAHLRLGETALFNHDTSSATNSSSKFVLGQTLAEVSSRLMGLKILPEVAREMRHNI